MGASQVYISVAQYTLFKNFPYTLDLSIIIFLTYSLIINTELADGSLHIQT